MTDQWSTTAYGRRTRPFEFPPGTHIARTWPEDSDQAALLLRSQKEMEKPSYQAEGASDILKDRSGQIFLRYQGFVYFKMHGRF